MIWIIAGNFLIVLFAWLIWRDAKNELPKRDRNGMKEEGRDCMKKEDRDSMKEESAQKAEEASVSTE